MVVNDLIVIEVKSVDQIHPISKAQVLTYMKLLDSPKGLIFNFNCANLIKEGCRLFVTPTYQNYPVR
ncbi:MAG: GxxExxY protein [Bacteroidetes bacterium]|nr:GxxExxY protein [Bacteroidota bacterium]MBU1718058.1 GxxExxY protein [Bacteroidota bacterium]